ncbi:MAG: hypothetical protein H6729_17345 [Deltaproteobacteria bacterium]|nr:hypothetical protein [Deltaproteobacteria bacterium]
MVELLIGGGAILMLGARWVVRAREKRRAEHRWDHLLSEVAAAREASQGAGALKFSRAGSVLELRGDTLGVMVTTRVTELSDGPHEARVTSTAPIEGEGRMVRFYLAWNHAASAEFAHVPKIPVPHGQFDGDVQVFAEDRGFAERFVKSAAIDLIDLRREACARGLELAIRGGHLTLTTHGALETRFMIEQLQIVTAHLCHATRRCRDAIGAADALDKD